MRKRSIVSSVLGFVHSLAVSIFILMLQGTLVLVALQGYFGVLIEVVDEGGGASGAHARRQVTVAQRIQLAAIFGSLGTLGAVGAYKLKAYYRRVVPSEIRDATKSARAIPELSPLKSGVWDRDLDHSL